MPRRHNPLQPRLQYIARTYPPFVTVMTLGTWAEATGRHDLRAEFSRVFMESGPDIGVAMAHLPGLMERYQVERATRYDRYLPWVAKELNARYKPFLRYAKQSQKPGARRGAGHRRYRARMPPSLFPPYFDPVRARLVNTEAEQIPHLRALAVNTRTVMQNFRAIVDWAEAERVDLSGVDFTEAIILAAAWAAEREKGEVSQGEVVYEFDDGWTVQELTTPRQFADEGDAMQHCVDAYDPRGVGTSFRIYSLRDPDGAPHVTMEWDPQTATVEQLKGKQNELPACKYLLRMIPFRRDVLDPQTRIRRLPHMNPGYLEWFRDEYLGIWAYNPKGTLADLIGKYGALEEAMKDDELFVVYAANDDAHIRSVDDMDRWLDFQRDHAADYVPSDVPSDEVDAWVDDSVRFSAEGSSVAGSRRQAAVGPDVTAPGLEWAVWSATGYTPEEGNTADEMVEALRECEVLPADGAIPRGREPVGIVKSRLTR